MVVDGEVVAVKRAVGVGVAGREGTTKAVGTRDGFDDQLGHGQTPPCRKIAAFGFMVR